jgi:5-methylcytosine-specific restriction endonuclease McrA
MGKNILQEDVLVLNKNWVWIGMTNVEEAIRKLMGGDDDVKAYIIDQDYQMHDFESWLDQPIGDQYIKTPRRLVAIPEVILMCNYGDVPRQADRWSRMKVLKRDRFTCQYCGLQPGTTKLTIDHVMPQSRGGRSTWENTISSCEVCNAKKGSRTPAEAGMKMRKRPAPPAEDMASRLHEIKEIWKPFVGKAKTTK